MTRLTFGVTARLLTSDGNNYINFFVYDIQYIEKTTPFISTGKGSLLVTSSLPLLEALDIPNDAFFSCYFSEKK